ncbi:beta type-7 [Seminavis robusta]|uniref:proteasome endopeptidase complex n=1 Tax=Seminavis robusta TaxID=568900 RepID=A0A9N8DDM3_9STRA|nr:beta type-7 [Seminavis robusta]|eukprot:Sro25_g016920.1 beta type-7 (323) ;mRNA; f:69383-70351
MSEFTRPMEGATEIPPAGFNFENVSRNARLMEAWTNAKEQAEAMRKHHAQHGMDVAPMMAGGGYPNHMPLAKKTGTTIAGIVFKGGVVLGADTRATNGDEVAEKNCRKIHYVADNMYCCGAGTAADTDQTTALVASQLELLRMDLHLPHATSLRMKTAVTRISRLLFRYQGHVSAALILGGVDKAEGAQLYSIHPHGSSMRFAYTAMGSGSLAAISVLESAWEPDMEEADAVTLVQRAITAGIFNDLGSGSNCDICVIKNDGAVDYQRPSLTPNNTAPFRAAITRSSRMDMKPGTTPILDSKFVPHKGATLADVTVTEMEVS